MLSRAIERYAAYNVESRLFLVLLEEYYQYRLLVRTVELYISSNFSLFVLQVVRIKYKMVRVVLKKRERYYDICNVQNKNVQYI